LDTWVVLTVARSISWHISWVIGHFWQQGRIVEGLQLSSRAWHLPTWGFSILIAQIYCIQSSLYIQTFGGMLESSIGAFCSISIVYLLSHLLSILDRHLHCSRFLYFVNKIIFGMFWFVYHIAYGLGMFHDCIFLLFVANTYKHIIKTLLVIVSKVFNEIPHSEKVLKRHQNHDDPSIMAWDNYSGIRA
jgi:hypothetical protein